MATQHIAASQWTLTKLPRKRWCNIIFDRDRAMDDQAEVATKVAAVESPVIEKRTHNFDTSLVKSVLVRRTAVAGERTKKPVGFADELEERYDSLAGKYSRWTAYGVHSTTPEDESDARFDLRMEKARSNNQVQIHQAQLDAMDDTEKRVWFQSQTREMDWNRMDVYSPDSRHFNVDGRLECLNRLSSESRATQIRDAPRWEIQEWNATIMVVDRGMGEALASNGSNSRARRRRYRGVGVARFDPSEWVE